MNCVYKIVCKDPTITEFYIGSTKNLDKRIEKHISIYNCKNNETKLYKFMENNGGINNWYITPIEIYDYNIDIIELTKEEQFYLYNYNPQLNQIKAYRTEEEKKEYQDNYRKINNNELKKKQKEHYEKNKIKILKKNNERNSKKINCPICNLEIRSDSLSRHKKRKH
tara:strand:- start:45 stop:545 length:501 start_codon:yes stop_codon:yes gene_type:complete